MVMASRATSWHHHSFSLSRTRRDPQEGDGAGFLSLQHPRHECHATPGSPSQAHCAHPAKSSARATKGKLDSKTRWLQVEGVKMQKTRLGYQPFPGSRRDFRGALFGGVLLEQASEKEPMGLHIISWGRKQQGTQMPLCTQGGWVALYYTGKAVLTHRPLGNWCPLAFQRLAVPCLTPLLPWCIS